MKNLTAITRFQRYIDSARRREIGRIVLVCAAVLLAILIGLTAAGTTAGMYRGFTGTLTGLTRVALAIAGVLVCAGFLWRPLGRLLRDRGARLVEDADAAFDGRVETFLDTRLREADHQFLPLLAQDGLSVARRVPLHRVVPASAIVWPIVLLLMLGGGFAGFVFNAPADWRNAALHIWWGWRQPGLVVPRQVAVTPGSTRLLAGDNLVIEAETIGFNRAFVTLNARAAGEQEWQSTDIQPDADGRFRFTVFRVGKPLEYALNAAYTESDVFNVSVVEPARIERIEAEYQYPDWTRLAPRQDKEATSISGVRNTEVSLSFVTDKPLVDGHLKLGDKKIALSTNGLRYSAKFLLIENTEYQLVDRILDRDVAISTEHAVILRGDQPPEVKFVMPGRDVSASPIEEVAVSLQVEDDFAIESIELLYSLNAGDWQNIDLGNGATAEHVFMLENMGFDPLVEGPSFPLEPGDLISYYVRVRDHDSVTETDMLLVDVRPFDRRFSEGQSGGGGGGGGPASEGSEISGRQKEILLATWNLLRSSEAANGDTSGMADNALLLSGLQTTLAEQARTLADRSQARELVQQGEKIRQFVKYLREAADAMLPSATALDELAFKDAIQPQQRALQLLQRAEALFADIRLTQQEGEGGGGGGQPGQDMAEMFELEMDLARNQYEQPDRGANQSASEKLDDIFKELEELAHRQQLLAEKAREQQELSREEQWRQEQLARDVEQLRDKLEQLQRESASNNEGRSAGLEQAAREAAEKLEQAQKALERETQQAAENSNPASGEPEQSAEPSDETAKQRQDNAGAVEAEQQLREALKRLGEERLSALQTGIESAVSSANDILRRQRETEQQLREAVQRAAQSRKSGKFSSGMTREAAGELAERKRELQRDLDSVREDVSALEKRFAEQAATTGEALREAVDELDESQAADMLGISADSIEAGSLATALPGESLITNAIRELRDRLADAADAASSEVLETRNNNDLQVADALRQLQDLRQELQLNDRSGGSQRSDQSQDQDQQSEQSQSQQGEQEQGQQGEQGQGQQGEQGQGQQGEQGQGQQGEQGQGQQGEQGQGQQGEQGQGQQGEQGQGQQGEQGQGQQGEQGQGQQGEQGQGQQGQGRQGSGRGQGTQPSGSSQQANSDASAQGSGVSNNNVRQSTQQQGYQREGEAVDTQRTADAIDSLIPDLDAIGIDGKTLDELRDSANMFRGGDTGINSARIEAEFRRTLRQVEQLELLISDNALENSSAVERLVRQGEVPEAAAEYYRKLSEQSRGIAR